MKEYWIGQEVTVDLPSERFTGKVRGFKKSHTDEQLYEITGDTPKPFITTTSARLINVKESFVADFSWD